MCDHKGISHKRISDRKKLNVWKQYGITALIVLLLLSGCSGKGDVTEEPVDVIVSEDEAKSKETTVSEDSITEQNNADIEIEIVSGEWPQGGRGYRDSVAWQDNSILDVENGQCVIYRTDAGVRIEDVIAAEDTVYAVLSRSEDYCIIAIDRGKSIDEETQEEYYRVTEVDVLEGNEWGHLEQNFGSYNNTLYMEDYSEDSEPTYHYYAYVRQEDGSYVKTQDEISLLIDELYERYGNGIKFPTSMNYLTEHGVLLCYSSSTLFFVDTEGNLVQKYTLNDPNLTIQRVGEKFFLRSSGPYYYLYDPKESGNRPVTQVLKDYDDYIHNILKLTDDYIYFYEDDFGEEIRSCTFYRLSMDTGEKELLFEAKTAPGQPEVRFYDMNFTIWNDCIYYADFDDGALWWFSYDLSDEEHTIARLDMIGDYNGRFGTVTVDSRRGIYYCGECGDWVYYYYIEDVQIADTSIPHWEEINEILKETTDSWTNDADAHGRSRYMDGTVVIDPGLTEPDEYADDSINHLRHTDYLTQSYMITLSGIGGRTLESLDGSERYDCLEFSYYEDWHSHQVRIYSWFSTALLFDLSDGSELDLGNICSISEEEFRSLAAEKTVEVCQDRYQHYFEDRGEEEIYATAYEYAGFDCMMLLNQKGVAVIYNTEVFGVEKLDFTVTIPYEELGLRLVDMWNK